MLPDADEETTALWGQNIAGNTGYLYHQKDTIHFANAPLVVGTTTSNDTHFTYSNSSWHLLKAHQDTFDGTFSRRWTTSGIDITPGSGTFIGTFFIDGVNEDEERVDFVYTAGDLDSTSTRTFSSTVAVTGADRWVELKHVLYISGTAAASWTGEGSSYDHKFTAFLT
jgi:hypothetical protein